MNMLMTISRTHLDRLPALRLQYSSVISPKVRAVYKCRSTTTNRNVAEQYSGANSDDGKLSIIIEMTQGMCDRGADLTPISQYPHEKEILFPPLTALQAEKR